MPLLSVIVPVYKVQDYLPECIESILNQTLSDLELILIDDGSPDQCGKICDEYAQKDKRIKVLHQTNQGVSSARNAGLGIAGGTYIGFVDPDDLIAPDMYEKMTALAAEQKSDIVICGFRFFKDDRSLNRLSEVPEGIFSRDELIASMYGMPNPFHGSMCNKLFDTRIHRSLRFDETVAIGEDWLLLYECYQRSERASAIKDAFYSVRMRDNSATRKKNAEIFVSKVDTYYKIYRFSKQYSKEIQKKAVNKIFDACQMNKADIKDQASDKKCLSYINSLMRKIACKELLQGNLSWKRAIYYFCEGLRF